MSLDDAIREVRELREAEEEHDRMFAPGALVRVELRGVLRGAVGEDSYEVWIPEVQRAVVVGRRELTPEDH